MPETGKHNDEVTSRRVLIITDAAKAVFQAQLETAGQATLSTTTARARLAISEFLPDVLIIEMAGAESAGDERVALARQLRASSATYALPIVFVCDECGKTFRRVAAHLGVDDCFGRTTPFPEVLARLDALLWRVEAGRRAPGSLGNQRLEIDNFLLLLDSIREQVEGRRSGTLALLMMAPASQAALSARRIEQLKREAFGFFKLNLRRLDAVAFYGPDALLICLPGLNSAAASSRLRELSAEFLPEHPGARMRLGLASFPADGTDVETLLEKCDAAASTAQTRSPAGSGESVDRELVLPQTEPVRAPLSQAMKHNAVASAEMKVQAAPVAPAERSESADAGRARRVLLAVSDAPRMARLNSLIRSAGYEVRAAFDGEQALNLLRIERPDLVLLESGLDKIDGLTMINRLLKQGGGRLLVPVLFLDSSGDENAGREALALGALKVVTQPFEPGDVLAGMRDAENVR